MKIISTYIFCLLAGLGWSQDTTLVCHHEDVGVFPLENLNTKSIEFSPVYYQSGLVFVVAREKNKVIDPKTGRAYFDLMYADLGPEGSTSKSVNFSPNIRTQYHEGPCAFNREGTELFFTRSNLSGGLGIHDGEGKVQLKIYKANKGAEDWENITELPFCNSEYAVAHPALSADGQYLVFASDMPGGFGGMDLYIVDRKNGLWSKPVNLGPVINTEGHELFPNWHSVGYLFFSSNGHEGKGGLDLFVTAWKHDTVFTGLQHLETPFNSTRDDLGMIISADGTSGYLASDRKPTKGKDDLYMWLSPKSIFCTPPMEPEITNQIMVIEGDGPAVDSAFVWLIAMNNEGPTLYKEHFTTELVPDHDNEGAYYMRWGTTDPLPGETANAISNATDGVMLHSNEKTTYLLVAQHPSYETKVDVFTGDQIPKFIRLTKKTDESAVCLNTLFTVYDESGKVELNGANIQINGSCLKAPLSFYTDERGSTSRCLPKGCALNALFMQKGYAQTTFTYTPVEEGEHLRIFLKSSEPFTSPTSPIATGTVIVLDNIYYDFNKSAIRKGDAGELIALSRVLKKYPDLTIELTSHTDTRGTAEYNMELSKKRSDSSKSYLVLLGIDSKRITTKAAGESSPRNQCIDNVPCTEEEHQYNRRTEVRITNPAQGMVIRYKAEG